MEPISWLVENLHLDLFIVVIVILSGFFQERVMSPWHWIKKDLNYDATLKTLVVSVVAVGVWIAIIHGKDKTVRLPWDVYFISYFTATSVYDLVIRPIRRWIGRKSGADETDINSKP